MQLRPRRSLHFRFARSSVDPMSSWRISRGCWKSPFSDRDAGRSLAVRRLVTRGGGWRPTNRWAKSDSWERRMRIVAGTGCWRRRTGRDWWHCWRNWERWTVETSALSIREEVATRSPVAGTLSGAPEVATFRHIHNSRVDDLWQYANISVTMPLVA